MKSGSWDNYSSGKGWRVLAGMVEGGGEGEIMMVPEDSFVGLAR